MMRRILQEKQLNEMGVSSANIRCKTHPKRFFLSELEHVSYELRNGEDLNNRKVLKRLLSTSKNWDETLICVSFFGR